MASRKRELQLMYSLWVRIAPLLPPKPEHPKGGRPFVSDRACFEDILYVLRNGIKWNAMPACYPSSTTCWNRFNQWTKLGIWPQIWKLVLKELQKAGKLDLRELSIDATFAEARKGGPASELQNAA